MTRWGKYPLTWLLPDPYTRTYWGDVSITLTPWGKQTIGFLAQIWQKHCRTIDAFFSKMFLEYRNQKLRCCEPQPYPTPTKRVEQQLGISQRHVGTLVKIPKQLRRSQSQAEEEKGKINFDKHINIDDVMVKHVPSMWDLNIWFIFRFINYKCIYYAYFSPIQEVTMVILSTCR